MGNTRIRGPLKTNASFKNERLGWVWASWPAPIYRGDSKSHMIGGKYSVLVDSSTMWYGALENKARRAPHLSNIPGRRWLDLGVLMGSRLRPWV